MPVEGRDINSPLPPDISPGAVIKHIEAASKDDLSRRLISGGAPKALSADLAEAAYRQANQLVRRQAAPHERAYAQRAANLTKQLGAAELNAISNAVLKGGTDGAKTELTRQLKILSALRKK
jgi:hypothetical protein